MKETLQGVKFGNLGLVGLVLVLSSLYEERSKGSLGVTHTGLTADVLQDRPNQHPSALGFLEPPLGCEVRRYVALVVES